MKIIKFSQAEIRTADCVAAIIDDHRFFETNPQDWKRQSKKRNANGHWVRIFNNKVTGQIAEVVEQDGRLIVGTGISVGTVGQPEFNSRGSGISFLPLDYPPDARDSQDWTGKMVFAFEDSEDDEVSFMCGPEGEGGRIDDANDGGAVAKLEDIFADIPDKRLMDAENYHTFPIPAGMSASALRRIIKQRLLAAGAVPYRDQR